MSEGGRLITLGLFSIDIGAGPFEGTLDPIYIKFI